MRIGLFGGSFDPVHLGHLLLAESCQEQVPLDEVWFCPTRVSPHKPAASASAEDRFEMLRLATAGNPAFQVRDEELKREGVSFTVDTLRDLTSKHAIGDWFFLMGADMLHDLPQWKEAETVCNLVVPICVQRIGSDPVTFDHLRPLIDAARIALFERHRVTMPNIELSSTEIRRRISEGQSIRYQTPPAVEEYIRNKGLYTG